MSTFDIKPKNFLFIICISKAFDDIEIMREFQDIDEERLRIDWTCLWEEIKKIEKTFP